MGKSLQLGSVAGIRLQVHWTFLLVVAWVALTSMLSGTGWLGAVLNIGFVLVLFGCVLLHELGHALAARLFGIPTKDITLLPIGGVARLEQMPRQPAQELVVALAGPAVNVVIAGLLLAALLPTVGWQGLAAVPLQSGGFLQQLMIVNVMLVVFNMLPVFPLDGGRVLRALLATVLSYSTATRAAATIGQICAVGIGMLGLMNPFLLIIAAFIFFGARAEARQVAVREKFAGYQVRDGMLHSFQAVPAYASIDEIGPQLIDRHQRDFPVIDRGELVGMLYRDRLLVTMGRDPSLRISDVMDGDVQPVEESDSLIAVLERASSTRGDTLVVIDGGAVTGLLDLQRVNELVMARANLHTRPVHTPSASARQPAESVI